MANRAFILIVMISYSVLCHAREMVYFEESNPVIFVAQNKEIEPDGLFAELTKAKDEIPPDTSAADSSQKIKKLINLATLQKLKTQFHFLSDESLMDLLVELLRHGDPDVVTVGQETLELYAERSEALNQPKRPCLDENIKRASIPLVSHERPMIRQRAVSCLVIHISRDKQLQELFFDQFQTETEPKTKGILLSGFREDSSENVRTTLIDVLVDGDNEIVRRYAANRLGKWDAPPQEALPFLVDHTREQWLESTYLNLLSSYGARAAGYLPELKKALSERKEKGWDTFKLRNTISAIEKASTLTVVQGPLTGTEGELRQIIEIKDPSDIGELEISLPEWMGLSYEIPLSVGDSEIADYSAASLDPLSEKPEGLAIRNPFYSNDLNQIEKILSTFPGNAALNAEDIRGAAAIGYRSFDYYVSGVNALVFSSNKSAKNAGETVLKHLISRRRLYVRGNVLFMLWWAPGDVTHDVLHEQIRAFDN